MNAAQAPLAIEPSSRCRDRVALARSREARALVATTAAALWAACITLPVHLAAAIVAATLATSAILARPRLGLYALAITVPWGSVATVSVAGADVTPSDAIVLLLVLSWIVRSLVTRRGPLERCYWNLPLALLLFAMVLSVSQAASLTLSLKEILKWVELALVFWIAPVFLERERHIVVLARIMIVAAVAEASLGLAQFALHAGPANYEIYGRFLRAYGTFGQPNPLAGYLNIVLPFAVALGWMLRRRWYWFAAAIIAFGSLATFSRAGWIAGALGIVVVLAVPVPAIRRWVVVAVWAAAAGMMLASFSLVPSGPIVRAAASLGVTGINFQHYTSTNFSEVERAAHWVAGLRMFADHPWLGVGIGNYPVAYPAYHVGSFVNALGHAHNYFINIAAETGLVGLAGYILFLATGIWYAVATVRTTSSGTTAALGAGMLGAWMSSTFHNLFDVVYVHAVPTLLGLLAGAVVAARRVAAMDAN